MTRRRGVAIAMFLMTALLRAQDWDNIEAERVATGLQYADGMVWSRAGFLIFGDVLKRKVYRLDPGVPPKPTPASEGGAQGFAYDSQGRLYICEQLNRRILRMDARGKTETLVDSFQGKKLNAPNDVVVRKDGNIYFTDPAFGSTADARELEFSGIFHMTPKGEVDAIAKWQTRPNGVAISNDGKTLFVTDSDRHAVVSFELDGKGAASNQRDVIAKIEGVPGGIRADVNGRLYVAARGLAVYAPDGKLLHTLLPGEIITNCAFGDNDFETLYASGRKSIYKIRLGVKGALQY